MADRESLRRAIDLVLQTYSYDRLGSAGAELAAGVRREIETLTRDWTETARARLLSCSANVERDRHLLDRGRNHYIRDFRLKFGTDPRSYGPERKTELDAAIADFTRRKSAVIDEAIEKLQQELALVERPV